MGFLPAGLVSGAIGAILTINTGNYDFVAGLTTVKLPLLGIFVFGAFIVCAGDALSYRGGNLFNRE